MVWCAKGEVGIIGPSFFEEDNGLSTQIVMWTCWIVFSCLHFGIVAYHGKTFCSNKMGQQPILLSFQWNKSNKLSLKEYSLVLEIFCSLPSPPIWRFLTTFLWHSWNYVFTLISHAYLRSRRKPLEEKSKPFYKKCYEIQFETLGNIWKNVFNQKGFIYAK